MKSPHLRKTPKQKRAKAMVDTILEATKLELLDSTKNKIAMVRISERAGISSGSLYQYFSSFEAILAELERQHQNAIALTIEAGVETSVQMSLRESTSILVNATVELHMADKKTHQAFETFIPPLHNQKNRKAMRHRIDQALKKWLKIHIAPEQTFDPASSVAVIRELVRSAVHQILEEDTLQDDKKIISEVIDMILSYVENISTQPQQLRK